MKQKYLLSVFLLAVGIALSSCKASHGELRSGKLASRLSEGGWQLHEVWSLTEQGEKRKCLLGERIAITSEEMYTYPKVVAPKLVFEGSKFTDTLNWLTGIERAAVGQYILVKYIFINTALRKRWKAGTKNGK